METWSEAPFGFRPPLTSPKSSARPGSFVTISSSVCVGIGCVVGLLTRVVKTLDVEPFKRAMVVSASLLRRRFDRRRVFGEPEAGRPSRGFAGESGAEAVRLRAPWSLGVPNPPRRGCGHTPGVVGSAGCA